MVLADAFAPAEAQYKEAVMQNAFGHLAPQKNRRYRGNIVFTAGVWGDEELNPVSLRCEFSNKTVGELQGSPWFYDFLQDFYFSLVKDGQVKPGVVYEFRGYFLNYRFIGEVRPLYDFSGEHPEFIADLESRFQINYQGEFDD